MTPINFDYFNISNSFWKNKGKSDRDHQLKLSNLNRKRLRLKLKAKKEENYDLYEICGIGLWYELGLYDKNLEIVASSHDLNVYCVLWGDVIDGESVGRRVFIQEEIIDV